MSSDPDSSKLKEIRIERETHAHYDSEAGPVSVYAATVRQGYLKQRSSSSSLRPLSEISSRRWRSRRSETQKASTLGTYARYYKNTIETNESGEETEAGYSSSDDSKVLTSDNSNQKQTVLNSDEEKEHQYEESIDIEKIASLGRRNSVSDPLDDGLLNEINESVGGESYIQQDGEHEDSFVNGLYSSYGGDSLFGRAGIGMGVRMGSSKTMKSWLPDFISAIPSDARNGAIANESRIDEIINGVPAKCIKNADAGLLSLLFAGEKQSKLTEDILSTDYTYAKISDPDEKRKHLFRILLGAGFYEDNCMADQASEHIIDGRGAFVDDPIAALPELPFDFTKTDEDTTLEIIKFLLDLCGDEKEDEIYQGEAWWMEGLEDVRVPVDDILKVDFDSFNVKGDNKIYNSQGDDDNPLEDDGDIDWDERLWEAARLHYHKAYPDTDNESLLELSQYQVSEFRSCMVTFLVVYARTFQTLSSNGTNPDSYSESVHNGLRVPSYVPMDIAKMLVVQITRICCKDSKESEASSVYIDGSFTAIDAPFQRHNHEIYAAALSDALLGDSFGCFDIFEVELVKSTGKSMSELRNRKYVKKEYQEDVINDRVLVDEFLYGGSAPKDTNLPFGRKQLVEAQTEQKPSKDVEREIRLRSSIVTNILHRYLDFYREIFDGMMPNLILRLLERAEKITEINLVREESDVTGVSDVSPRLSLSLSTVYACKYAIIFLLRCPSMNQNHDPGIDSNGDDSASRLRTIKRAQQLLLDSFFIRQRIRIYGSFVSVKDHIHDWLSVSAFMQEQSISKVTDDRMYFNDDSRKNYCLVHEKLDNELKRTLDSIFSDVKEIEEEEERHGKHSLLLEEATCASYISRLVDNVYRILEVGRSSHRLGFNLGKSEQLLNDGVPIKAISEMEISNYDVAVRSYRGATAVLRSCTRALESINADILPEESLKLQSQCDDIKDLCISTDLHLADTLIALGYCNDVKLVEHDRAMSFYREALKLYKHLGNNHFVFINALQNVGTVHFERGNYNDSLKCYKHRLRILQKMEKESKKKDSSKSNHEDSNQDSVVKVQEEICFTIQSIARVFVKLGKRDLAIKEYSECIERMRDIKEKCWSNDASSLFPKAFLDESLCELSALYTYQASTLFTAWTEGGLSEMFGPRPTSNVEPYNFDFSAALDVERKALNCLDESIHFRLGLKEYEGHSGQRYNFRLLLDSLALVPTKEMTQFRSDLTRNGMLKFRHRQYKESELDLLFALNMYLSDGTRIQEELPLDQFLEKMSHELLSDVSSYDAVLPILFQMGTLCTRLRNLDDSVSFFELTLRLCTDRFSAGQTTPGEKLGIQLDLADIHRNLGFVYLQKGEQKLAASHLRSASRLLDRIVSHPSEDVESDADEFLLEVHVKVSIVIVLNYLGRVYDQRADTLERSLVCFEDSMIILEDVLDEFNQDGDLFKQMKSISRIATGSVLQQPFSLLSLGRVLGDNYYRAGKIYMQNSLHIDAELAFHRSINIFDVLKDEQYFSRDDGAVEDHDSDKLHRDLLDACKGALSLLEEKYVPYQKRSHGTDLDNDLMFEDDELSYSVEDLLFRIGNCYGEMGEYDQALGFLYNARKMTKAVLGSQNFVVASILHNIGSVQRSIFFDTADEDARYKAIHAFQEAVYISRGCKGRYELFLADSMYRVVEMKMVQRTLSTSETISLAYDDQLLQYLESVLHIRLRYHGDFHADVSLTRYLLGKVYYYRNDPRHALHHLDLALSQWQDLFTSVNLDIFDAIYFRGLCHQQLASIIEDGQLRQKELDAGAKYFHSAIHHSNKFYLAASSSFLPDSAIRKSCLVQSIQCALQLMAVKDNNVKRKESSAHHMKILSTIYHVITYFEDNESFGVDVLRALAAKTWMQVAIIHQHSRERQSTIKTMKAAVDLYSSLCRKDTSYLLDKTICSLMLAREYMANDEDKLSLELWRVISISIVKICGKDSPESASVMMYIGSISDISQAPRYFQGARKLYEQQDRFKSNLIPSSSGIGQKGILYKNLACINIREGKPQEAMENVFKAISIVEQVRQLPRAPQVLPETLEEVFFKIEDWDVILFECYIICLQIASSLLERNSLQAHAADILNRISFLLGEVENIEESFQCFYSLLLHALRSHGDTNANVANVLFNMGNISGRSGFQPGSALFYEEFYNVTSAVLGNSLTLLPCVMVLSMETYQDCEYGKAMKWADVGLASLRDTTTFENEAMKLIAIKSMALIKLGKLNPAKRLLEKAKEGMKSRSSAASDIHWALGQVHSALANPKGARIQYYECLKLRQDYGGCDDITEVHCAIGELHATYGFLDEARKYYVHGLWTTTMNNGCDHVAVADCLLGLAKEQVDPENAQRHLHEAIRIYRLNGRTEKLARTLADFGSLLEKDCQIDAAQKYFMEALDVLDSNRGDIMLHTEVLHKTASNSYVRKDYKSAARHFEKLITFAKRIDGNQNNLGIFLYWFGCASYFLGRHEASQKSLQAAIKHFKKDNGEQKNMVMVILTRLAEGRNHIKADKVGEAEWCVNEAMRLIKPCTKSFTEDELVKVYLLSGEIFRALGNFERSIESTKKALKVGGKRRGIQKQRHFLDAQLQIIELYLEVGEYVIARELAFKFTDKMAYQLQGNTSKMSLIHGLSGDIERELGEIETAIIHYEKAIALRDEPTIDSCEVILKLAKCRRIKNHWEGSLQNLVQAEEAASFLRSSESFLTRVRLERANVFFKQGKIDATLAIYASTIGNFHHPDLDCLTRLELSPIELVDIYTQIGSSLVDQTKLSLEYLEKAVQICSLDQIEYKMLSKQAWPHLIKAHEVLIEQCRAQVLLVGDSTELSFLQKNLGNTLICAKEFQRAIIIFEDCLEHQRHANDRLQLSTTLHNIGSCYFELGNMKKAIPILEEALNVGKAVLGHDHVDVADTTFTLARACEISSDIEASISYSQETFKIRIDAFGMKSSQIIQTMHAMGMALIAADRVEGAIKIFQDALRIQKGLPQQINRFLRNTTHFLIAQAFMSNESPQMALRHLQIFMKSPCKRSSGIQVEIATALYQIGKIHHIRGSTSTADKYFEKSMAEIQAQLNFQILDHSANLGTEHKPIKSPRSLLLQAQSSLANQELKFADLTLLCGVLLKQASRYSESLVCLNFAHEIFTKILKPSSLRISEVLLEKGCVFSELKEYANASFVLEQLLALCKNTSANSSKQVVEGMRLLSICERKLGHNEKYVTLLKQIATMTKKSPSTGRQIDRYEDTNVLFLVGNLHYEQNQVVAALDFYKRCSNLFRSMKGGKSRRSMLEVAIATGNAYLKGGSPFRALMSFEQALFDAEGMGSTLLVYESLSSMGNLYCELGRYEDAIENFKQCLRLQQEHKGNEHESTAQILISLGATHALHKEYDRSKNAYKKAIHVLKKLYGNYKDVGICWLKVGDVHMKENCLEEAIPCYEEGLSIIKAIDETDGSLWDAYYGLGLCYLRQNRYKEALSALSNALILPTTSHNVQKRSDTLIPLGIAQFNIGDLDDSLENLNEAINASISRLNGVVEAENVHKGIDIALEILKKRHGTLNIQFAQMTEKNAICLATMNDYSGAITSHMEALKVYRIVYGSSHINVKNSLFNIGLCLNSLSKTEKARRCLQQAYKMTKNMYGDQNIESAEIKFHIGISYKLEGDWKEASQYFDDSISLRIIYSDNGKSLAETFEMAGDAADANKGAFSKSIDIAENNYTESIRLYRNLSCHQETTSLHIKLANLYARSGKYSKAIVHFEKSLVATKVLNGSTGELVAELYLNLGIAHDSTKNLSKAIKCFDSCIEMKQVSSTKALICKGIASSKIGEFDEALNSLSIAIGKATEPKMQADVHVARGHVLDMMNDNAMAMQCYLSALSIYRMQSNNEDAVSSTCQAIANYHLREARFDAANEFSEEAFEIRKSKWGMDHHLTAESLYHRGSIFFVKKEWEQSLSCLELALFTFKKIGINSALKANALYMIGCAQEKLDRRVKALVSLNEALVLHRERKGPNHIDVARTLRRIGVLYQSKEDYSNSQSSLNQSLRISVDCLGSNHKEVLQVYEYLAETLCRDLQYSEGLSHIMKAITIHEGHHGKSLDLARCYGLHGTILDQAGKTLDEVIDCYNKSKDLYVSLLQDKHCNAETHEDYMTFASIVFKLAMAQERSGKDSLATKNYAFANRLYQQALKSSETLYHADILQKLANLKGRQKKYDKACVLLEETLRIRIKILGMKDKSVAHALFSLGILFSKKHEYEAALKTLTDCLTIQQTSLGVDAIETADTLRAIGQCLGNSGDYLEAVNVWNEAYGIYSKHENGSLKLKALKRDLDLGYRLVEGSS